MATLATQLHRAEALSRPTERTRVARAAQADPFRLRALPNEDICLFSKRIDNARLVKQADPAAGGRCWSAIGAAALAAILLTGVAFPRAAWFITGYRLQSLRQEQQRLVDERSRLDVEEAALVTPARLDQLAGVHKLVSPSPRQVIRLDPKADGSLALNLRK
jgi:hypothetical protein